MLSDTSEVLHDTLGTFHGPCLIPTALHLIKSYSLCDGKNKPTEFMADTVDTLATST